MFDDKFRGYLRRSFSTGPRRDPPESGLEAKHSKHTLSTLAWSYEIRSWLFSVSFKRSRNNFSRSPGTALGGVSIPRHLEGVSDTNVLHSSILTYHRINDHHVLGAVLIMVPDTR